MKKILKKILPNVIIKKIKAINEKNRLYQNINLDILKKNQKKVLISYITKSLETNFFRNNAAHPNIFEINQIIKSFIKLNYSIDVINSLDEFNLSIICSKEYDVIFGFGEPFYKASINNKNAKKIIYLTERHPNFSKLKEKERIKYYYKRHHTKVNITRSGRYYRKKDIDIADYAIILGSRLSYENISAKIKTLNPTGLINTKYIYKERNFKKSKKNFVWFGSYGVVHKGLDILIDVFNDLKDINLYICGLNDSEKWILKNIQRKNIKYLGFININSDYFIDLMNKCSYVILPSCAESSATGVLTCMNHGLIPVVTKEVSINFEGRGLFLLEDYTVEYVKDYIIKLSNLGDKLISTFHKEIFEYSRKNYNITRFSKRFDKILREILPNN